jgi:flavin-dependent dehydrogenase
MPSRAALEPDVLILGDHPCAHLAAAVLQQRSEKIRVLHASGPGEIHRDRLVVLNPGFFDLHKLLAPLKRKLKLVPIHGLKFLADDPQVRSEWTSRSIVGYVAHFRPLHEALMSVARDAGVQCVRATSVHFDRLDESGAAVRIDGRQHRVRLILLACHLPAGHKRALGLPEAWEPGVMHRHTSLFLEGNGWRQTAPRAALAMSLDLRGTLWWAWMLPGPTGTQISVVSPHGGASDAQSSELLRHWAAVLHRHKELAMPVEPGRFDAVESIDLPLAGALAQEGVANRTILLGPAGGFYTACGEDIYPNCWSALYAVDTAVKALKEKHVQDALHTHRQKWGATLGDFLRGPQQNLRFLLPLVYRNPTMTARLAEAILLGKSVVR